MEFMDVIKKRRSIRKFKNKEVPDEILKKIVEATAKWTPSARNLQPWHFVIIRDKEKMKKLRELYDIGRRISGAYPQDTGFVEKAKAILICSDGQTKWSKTDCYLAVQNILLIATDFGLGTLCLGSLMKDENMQELRKLCNIPDNIEPVMPILVGYPDEEGAIKPRKDLKEAMHFEEF